MSRILPNSVFPRPLGPLSHIAATSLHMQLRISHKNIYCLGHKISDLVYSVKIIFFARVANPDPHQIELLDSDPDPCVQISLRNLKKIIQKLRSSSCWHFFYYFYSWTLTLFAGGIRIYKFLENAGSVFVLRWAYSICTVSYNGLTWVISCRTLNFSFSEPKP